MNFLASKHPSSSLCFLPFVRPPFYPLYRHVMCFLNSESTICICCQERIQEVKKDMSEFSESIRMLPPVTSELLTEDDVDGILVEDEKNDPEKNVDSKAVTGLK